MRTAIQYVALLLWLVSTQAHAQAAYAVASPWQQAATPAQKAAAAYPPARDPRVQAASIAWLVEHQDARETWGTNRGPLVDPIIRAGGGTPGQEWCGFTQAANQRAHGLPIPAKGLQGGARYWFTDATGAHFLARTQYAPGRRGSLSEVQPGDLTGFIWRYQTVIHHITRVAQVVPSTIPGRPPRGFWTWGGNEGKGTNAGLKLTYYPAPSISAAARWDYK